jgi:hypothetical protein
LQWWIPSLLQHMRLLVQHMLYIKVHHYNWGYPPSFDACTLQSRIRHMSRCTIATGDTLPPLMDVSSDTSYIIRQGAPLQLGIPSLL